MVHAVIKERMLQLADKRLRNRALDLAALRHELQFPGAGSPVYLWRRLEWTSAWWNGQHLTSLDAELLELIDWWIERPPAAPAPVPDVDPLPSKGGPALRRELATPSSTQRDGVAVLWTPDRIADARARVELYRAQKHKAPMKTVANEERVSVSRLRAVLQRSS